MQQAIAGVIFDSGGTLMRPLTAGWWPYPHVRRIVEAHGLGDLPWERYAEAHRSGMAYLDANHRLSSEDEERAQFREYYRIVIRGLSLAKPAPALLAALAGAHIAECEFEPFPDARTAIEAVRARGLRLGLISNAWPSLEGKYRRLGLRDCFDSFVISACAGCLKPDAAIFELAAREIGLPPRQLLFVDDEPEYVDGARAAGLGAVLIARDGPPVSYGGAWLSALGEVERLLDG
ncbi:MAG TPA: HAD-IA family hydrolase [Dehalococcoidia bacterium]|nr:HAD-IA family hydrolase [Dehalococcoidia bacterium]